MSFTTLHPVRLPLFHFTIHGETHAQDFQNQEPRDRAKGRFRVVVQFDLLLTCSSRIGLS